MSNNIKWIALLTATFLLIVTTSAIMPDDVDGSDTYFEEGGIWYKIVGESEVEIANPSVASGSSSAPSTYSGNFVVPESVNHDDIDYSVIGIGYDAFNEANISSIDLPDSLEYIENRAFQGSTLTSISIPVSVTRIGFFFDDPSAIGNGSYGVFWNIDDQNPSPLKTIEFEGDRTKELVIGNGAFWNLEITSLVLPDGVTTIGVHAFEKCDKLESLNIPDSVSFIGYGAFDGCESLNELSIPGRSDLDLDEQDYFTWDEKCMGALTGWLDRYDVTLELGEGSRYTFDSDSGLLYAGTDLLGAINSVSGNVTIPDGITAIAPYAFANCVSITGISIPSTVAKIYENAFIGCDSLQTVNIANADVDIDLSSFMGSHSLQSLIIGGAEIIQNRMIVNDGVLVAYLGSGTSETIGDNITSIGQSAFEGNTTLKEVFIGNTVSSIGYYAFNDCSSLEKIVFENGTKLYSIGYFAFSGTAIKTIMIPGGPGISLGNIFGNCTSLQTIILDKSTTRISFLTNNHSDDTISLIAFGGSASSYSFYFKGDIYILSGRIDDGISKIYTTSEIDNTITIDIADYIESVDGLQTSIQWFRNGQECGDSYTLTLDKPGIYNATLTFSFYGQEITVDAVNKTVSDDNSISIKFMVDDAEYSEYYISSGEKIVAPADPSKTGYVFSGWYIEGGSQPFDFDQPIAANTVLTAHWEPISYTVSFDSNGGDGTMQSLVIDYGETIELETCGFSRTGYIFTKWNTMPDGSGDYYPDGAQITNLASIDEAVVTLYAQWEPISYTVSFDSNGGDGTMSDMVMTYDTEYVLNANSFQKEGFEFNGWSTSENGKVEYEDGETVKNLLSVDGEITLYASWSKVTANPDGTETSVTTETDTVGSQTITTTVTTVINSETGEVINTTTEISTSSGNITTTATVSGSEAIVTVNAESSASLDDVVGQAELISKVIKEDPELPDDVSEMEIVFENEGVGASVTLTLDVVSSLKEQARTASVLIVVDDFESQSMTPEQIMALGNGTAFELSAVVVDEDNNIISTLHELGGYVDAFLPYSGDVSGLGVFYIDEQGNTTHMESRYDSTREGFVFKTNHFSMFAVMAIPEVIPDEPNIPPYYPDDDYPYIPPTIVVNDDGSDDNLTIIACAAAAVVAALMAVFLIVEYRKK